jgi:hypothetical protein
MIREHKHALRSKIHDMLSTEEWMVCFFSAIPNIFTEELLNWCLSDKLSIKAIKSSVSKLLELNFISKQYNKDEICFFTMHERFREIMNVKEDTLYILFCKRLLQYYNDYIPQNNVFSSQYYNDKLFYQITLNNNTEWRKCYQYTLEKGDYFESEKLINIYQKAITSSTGLLYAWYEYYKLQNEIVNHKICSPDQIATEFFTINNSELNTYWLNICGVQYINQGKYEDAENFFTNAIIYTNKASEINVVQYNKCIVYFYTQQYFKAFKLLSEFYDAIDSEDLFFLIKCKFLLAVINMHIYKLDIALIQFEEVLNLKETYQTQLKNTYPLYLCHKTPRPLCASINKSIYNFIGEVYLIQGKFQQAISYHLKGLEYNKTFGNISGMAWANNDLGKVYYISGNTQAAQKYLENSICLFESSNDQLSKAFPLIELSYVYQYNGDVQRTICLLKESLFLLKQKKLINDMLSALNNLGRLYQSQGFLNAAKIIFDFCLSKFDEKQSVKGYLGWLNNNIARNYLYLNEYDNALIYFKIALNIFNEIHEKRGYIYVVNNIGEVYAKQENYYDALQLLSDALHQKEEMGDMHSICYSYRELGELYLKLGQPKIAYSYINKAFNICELGNFIMLKGDIWMSYGNYYLMEQYLEKAVSSYTKALNNYKGQSFHSRSFACAQKINEIIQKYNYTNLNIIDDIYIYNKLKTDEMILIQELQGLLNNLFD